MYCIVWSRLGSSGFILFFLYLDYGVYCIVLYIEVLRFVLNYVFVFFGLDWLVFDWLCFCFDLDSFAFVFLLVRCLFDLLSFGFIWSYGMVWYVHLFFFHIYRWFYCRLELSEGPKPITDCKYLYFITVSMN